MDKECILGQTGVSMMVIMKRIKNLVKVHTIGLMDVNTQVNGLKESSMAKAFLLTCREFLKEESGLMVLSKSGLKNYRLIIGLR